MSVAALSPDLGTVDRMRIGPSTEATFVAGRHGRDGTLALWELPGGSGAAADDRIERRDEVTVVLADGPRTVPADLVPVGDAVATLAALPAAAEVRPSVRAWSVATRLALDAVSRGRLLPAVADDGADTWRVGPLDVADRTRLDQLADALPPAAHATPVDGDGGAVRMTSPNAATTTFLDAVADAFVRTAAAAATVGFEAFAAPGATDVTGAESWLQSTVAGTASDTSPGLRIDLPEGPDDPVRCVLQVQSRLDPSLVLDAAELWRAPTAVVARFGSDVTTDLLLALRAAARVWAPVERLLEEATPEVLVLEDAEAEELLRSRRRRPRRAPACPCCGPPSCCARSSCARSSARRHPSRVAAVPASTCRRSARCGGTPRSTGAT